MTRHFVRVAAVSDVSRGGVLVCNVGGIAVLLCDVDGQFHAIENRCSHMAMPLDKGRLAGAALTCPFHGSTFDVRSGASIGFPMCRSIRSYETRIIEGFIEVDIPPAQDAPQRNARSS